VRAVGREESGPFSECDAGTEHELIDGYGPVAVAVAGTRGRSGLSNGAGQVEPKTVNPTKVDGSAGKTLSE
jgi:hypothetical protein